MDSLEKRLIGSVRSLFAVQGEVPKGLRVIVPGIAKRLSLPKWVTARVPAYRYSNPYLNRTRPIPKVYKTFLEPPVPMIQFEPMPVENRTSIQKLLEDLEVEDHTIFEDYTGEFHFWSEKRRSRINPIYHQGISHFKQDCVVRVYLEEGEWDIVWPREKVSPRKPIPQQLISQY